mmetsp:Transcript_21121/g.68082  ORF Transcript_21121/g.68082 Transcript_21121/m.68082 type:complete len:310 (-) Transcript_21121:75-1004(-)
MKQKGKAPKRFARQGRRSWAQVVVLGLGGAVVWTVAVTKCSLELRRNRDESLGLFSQWLVPRSPRYVGCFRSEDAFARRDPWPPHHVARSFGAVVAAAEARGRRFFATARVAEGQIRFVLFDALAPEARVAYPRGDITGGGCMVPCPDRTDRPCGCADADLCDDEALPRWALYEVRPSSSSSQGDHQDDKDHHQQHRPDDGASSWLTRSLLYGGLEGQSAPYDKAIATLRTIENAGLHSESSLRLPAFPPDDGDSAGTKKPPTFYVCTPEYGDDSKCEDRAEKLFFEDTVPTHSDHLGYMRHFDHIGGF